jgi:hypothetical protein
MQRISIIGLLCLSVAFFGIAGIHGHWHEPHSTAGEVHEHSGGHSAVELVSLLHADHFEDHGAGGEIDVQPVTKAFGKVSVIKLLATLAFIVSVIQLLSRTLVVVVRRWQRTRTPESPHPFALLPPSHAPPVTAFAR